MWLYPLRALSAIPGALIGTARNAAIILTATRATVEAIPRHYRNRCVPMLENGVDQARFHPQQWPTLSKDRVLNIVFVGRLVPCKGLPMLLEAMSQVRDEVTVKLTVVGDGPMRTAWEQEGDRLGLSARVTFKGALGLDEVAEEICAAHALCLPSVRESGGAVLLEAMASGRPVIAVNFGGPSEIVDDEVGVLVPPTNWESVVQGLADALRSMANEPDRWHQRAAAARRRAEARFSWDAKVDAALEIYRELLSSPNLRATLSRDAA